MGGLKNRPTVRLITWLIVARCSGQKGCSSRTYLSDFVLTKEVSSIIGFSNILLKTFSRYDNLEVVRLFLAQGGNILETYPGGWGGGYSPQWPIRGGSAQKEYLIWPSGI